MAFFHFNRKNVSVPAHKNGDLCAPVKGQLIEAAEIKDPVFSGEMIGQTIGFIPHDGIITAPANGVLESIFPTGHAFTMRMKDGTGLMVHIGIDTVEMKGEGFQVLKQAGQEVEAGEQVVKVDLKAIARAGYDDTIILVIAEPVGESKKIMKPGEVDAGDSILR
jgi:glucose-specific phosphotransferase system IIA component